MLHRKISKSDEAKLQKLRPTAAQYEKHAHRAKTWFANTGTPMFEPGGLTHSLKRSRAAQAEIDTILTKYR